MREQRQGKVDQLTVADNQFIRSKRLHDELIEFIAKVTE